MLFLSFQTLMQLQTEDNGSQLEKPMDIPKELWILVDYLYRNAIQQVGGAEVFTPDRGHAALRKSISPENFGQKTPFLWRTCGMLLFHRGVEVDRFTCHTPMGPHYDIQHLILQEAWEGLLGRAYSLPGPLGSPSRKASETFSECQPAFLCRNSCQLLGMGGAHLLTSQTGRGTRGPSGHESGSLISRVGWASFLPSDWSVSLTGLSGAQGDP